MPVEIRELIIRAVVNGSKGNGEADPDDERRGAPSETDAIIEECVRQVLKILKKSGKSDMALGDLFKLEKLKILAYGNRLRIGLPLGIFEAMFNPESFKRKYEILYGKYQGLNTSGRPLSYAKSTPSDLNLTLVLDGTGTTQFGVAQLLSQDTVSKRIEKLLDLAFYMNGDIHEPNFLVVKWAELEMPCRLGSVDINYTNFDRDGTPLRASLDIRLISDESSDLLKRKERKNSPDLSHSRIVKAGDTLPLLAKEIYGSSSHYLWVAEANGLDEIRRLTPGQQLVFPPLPPAASP